MATLARQHEVILVLTDPYKYNDSGRQTMTAASCCMFGFGLVFTESPPITLAPYGKLKGKRMYPL
jgi:hypothetical protein